MICQMKTLEQFLSRAFAYSQLPIKSNVVWCRKGLCLAPRSSLPYLLSDVINALHNAVELCTTFASGNCAVATVGNRAFVLPFVELPHEVVPPLEEVVVKEEVRVPRVEFPLLRLSSPYLLTVPISDGVLISYRLRKLT